MLRTTTNRVKSGETLINRTVKNSPTQREDADTR